MDTAPATGGTALQDMANIYLLPPELQQTVLPYLLLFRTVISSAFRQDGEYG